MADTLILTAERIALAVLNPDRSVMVALDLGEWQDSLGRPIAIRFSPEEARRFALALQRKADEAEGR